MRPRVIVALAAALSAATVCQSAPAEGGLSKTVVTIHSGAPSFPSNPILDAGIRDALVNGEVPVDYYAEYLESDLFPSDQALRAFHDYIRRKYEGRRIDVVIAMTDVGLQFVLSHRSELFPDTPIVFFGLAAPDEATRRSGSGITGVTVGIAYAETLKLALALHPSTQRVFVVAKGPEPDDGILASVQAEFRDFSGRVNLTYLHEETVPLLLSAVRAVPTGSVILYIWQSETSPGNVLYSDAVAQLVADAAPVPVYGTSDLFIGRGVVGGVVRNTSETGHRLGEMALRILTGTRPRDIPVEAARVMPILDWRQVQRWRIAHARVPANSHILFREPSAWDRYKVYIVGAVAAVLAQAALIAVLLIHRTKRRRAEQQVLRGQAALRKSYERVRDLGSRLLNAQEEERSRIARELHDDISQQLAVLKVDLKLWSRTAHGDAEALAAEAIKRAENIGMSVHDLARRLHPARLRLIGLVEALEGLRSDLSQPGLTITLTHENVPPKLPPELTICLYRVAQEALQNAVKYSRAQNVRVDVRVSDEIVLTIVDDGVGFDVEAAWGRGLGLVSGKERVEAIGGTFAVYSSPGAGTTLEIRVPTSILHGRAAMTS